jgi:hypothetical protein
MWDEKLGLLTRLILGYSYKFCTWLSSFEISFKYKKDNLGNSHDLLRYIFLVKKLKNKRKKAKKKLFTKKENFQKIDNLRYMDKA